MKTRILGIDLAVTAAHKAVILDQERNEFVGAVIRFHTNPAEMDVLLAAARAGVVEEVELIAILEATGMAWYTVGSYLLRHGVRVYRVNGQETLAQRKVYQRRAKSDRIDARILARMYLTIPERLRPLYLPDADHLTLQRACRELNRLTQLTTASKNRIQATDQLAWLNPQEVWPEDEAVRRWLRTSWYDPWKVAAAGLAGLQTDGQQCFPGQESGWLSGWLEHARLVVAFYGRAEALDYAQLQASQMREQARLEELQRQCSDLRQQVIRPLYRRLHPQRLLETLYGIGEDSAAVYIAFIGDIHRFPTVSHFRSWCGLIPYSNQSGESQAKGLRITKAGPDLLKKTIFTNTEVARLYDPDIAACYYDQMIHKGNHHLHAICACAAHLLKRIYAVLRDQRPYELRDSAGRVLQPAQARQLCQDRYCVPDEVRRRNNARARKARAEQRTERRYQRQVQKRSKG